MGLMDTVKGWFGMAKGVAGDAVDKAQDMAGDAVNKVQEVAGDAMEKAGDMAGQAKDAAGDAVDKVQEMMPGGDDDDAGDETATAAE